MPPLLDFYNALPSPHPTNPDPFIDYSLFLHVSEAPSEQTDFFLQEGDDFLNGAEVANASDMALGQIPLGNFDDTDILTPESRTYHESQQPSFSPSIFNIYGPASVSDTPEHDHHVLPGFEVSTDRTL